ncbi:DEAD/DEAH box helicase family protein [Thalassotalea mangrovi]|uniref:DEAD/DEAH box helicase n=1 Tax=Thalassotalea mangrovi TaxID=2572245 RepID=A0A4U1B8P6_9GAMM|nr:DEAD/DEAH box helicase family protein [Thalassotalea mangrovi]TKB46336.1 DEAD/DEAH box helicase [Thalassotalea mangrovi]
MSSLKQLGLKNVYRTGHDNLYTDFYRKSLAASASYDRAVGYFSSEILAMSSKGLSRLISSNGKMRLIIGHPLTDEEFDAVKHGLALKAVVADLSLKLEEMLESSSDKYPRLELLSWLIASGKLEIKFALRRAGMYHEKIGIFRDLEGNIVVFQGSANETPHGMVAGYNAESISVYKSWEQEIFTAYGEEYLSGFERLWKNEEIEIVTLDIPSSTYDKISKSLKVDASQINSLIEFEEELEARQSTSTNQEPKVPQKIGSKTFNIYDHQKDALSLWKSNSFKGILKLATGSGKTITSIYGAVKIYEAKKKKGQQLFLIVAVPYVELAIQWIDNLKLFGINAHECFDSKSSWATSLENQVNYFNSGITNFCAAVVVNRTLTTPYFQSLLNSIDETSLMLIGDECHNHGSKNINALLPTAYYRMGLSATPFRSDDDEIDSPFPNDAKQRLLSYYGDIVATYGLDDAIHDGVLTPYEYHIIPIFLTLEEQEKYEDISKKITKIILTQQTSGLSKEDRENLTKYCGQRSRLLGSAQNKLIKLAELTANVPENDKTHSLFYAGEGKPFGEYEEEDIKVIDQVSKVLNKNGWKTSQFTGDVSRQDRKFLMSAFKDQSIDALVAMKVLDEGIDVPACKTAYILASTKNPRQYVQRRGRILRKSENKHIAKIYDFVVLPANDSNASQKLKISEAERINDFALLAVNKIEIEKLIEEHGLSYDIT